jgi:hypothetical protein
MNYSVGIGCALTVASTTFIFLQRLRAVFPQNRWVQIVAILLWLGVCVTMAFTVVDSTSMHIPGTQYCIYSVVDRSLIANGAAFVAFDTFVLAAISYKIAACHSSSETGITWGTAVSGKTLSRVSKAILRGGQQYYL